MFTKKMIFVILALMGLLTATGTMLFPSVSPLQLRGSMLVGGETRAAVESSLQKLLPVGTASAQDSALQSAVQLLRKEKYVTAAWLVDENGNIVVHEGGPGKAGDPVLKVGKDTVNLLEGMPQGTIDSAQYLQLAALGAMRAEGEHNDVFRHLVRPLLRADGSLGALVVVAYDASPAVSSPGFTYTFFLFLGLAGLTLYWLALPAWIWLDARQRREPAALWVLFVLVTNWVGLIAYLIAIRAQPSEKA